MGYARHKIGMYIFNTIFDQKYVPLKVLISHKHKVIYENITSFVTYLATTKGYSPLRKRRKKIYLTQLNHNIYGLVANL
jgi:hypothetical protein